LYHPAVQKAKITRISNGKTRSVTEKVTKEKRLLA
jgi:hypothetical protein